MKAIFFKLQLVTLVLLVNNLLGQTSAIALRNYPDSFTISSAEINHLFTYNLQDKVMLKSNEYLNNAVVVYKYEADNVHQLKLQLAYFSNSVLMVQINADATHQIFVLSEDSKGANYKNKSHKPSATVIMEKCEKEKIVSE